MESLGAVRALALDLDGTLLLPGAIMGEKTAGILRRCLARGLRIIFCTGRSAESLERYRARTGAEGPAVIFNGAVLANLPAGRILKSAFLPQDLAASCAGLGREAGVYTQAYVSRGSPDGSFASALLAEKECEEAAIYRSHTGTKAEFGSLRAALETPRGENWIKLMFISREPESLARVRARIEDRFGGQVYHTMSAPIFLEVLAAGADKGAGLAAAMENLGLRPEEVIAFGDEENDLPMFRAAGHSAAPADAKPSVRAAAGFAAGPCGEEGVAGFLEKAFLA